MKRAEKVFGGSALRKTAVCVLMCLLCLVACGTIETLREELYYCENCGEEVTQAVEAEGGSGYYCYACAIDSEYTKCRECGGYYENDGFDCNDVYCHYCFERSEKSCFLCWQSFGDMVTITAGGEDYYICPDCATDYFANIEPMKPVDYCGDCGKVFPIGDERYEHYIFTGVGICPECLVKKGYEKCVQCGKYTDDGLVDGRCGYCVEKGLG